MTLNHIVELLRLIMSTIYVASIHKENNIITYYLNNQYSTNYIEFMQYMCKELPSTYTILSNEAIEERINYFLQEHSKFKFDECIYISLCSSNVDCYKKNSKTTLYLVENLLGPQRLP
jgi:hypothetical protein